MEIIEYKNDYLPGLDTENYGPEEYINENEGLPEEKIKYKDYDPVRLYLKEMSNLPMLSREEELYLAKKIRVMSRLLQRRVLRFDYALENYVRSLEDEERESDLIQFI